MCSMVNKSQNRLPSILVLTANSIRILVCFMQFSTVRTLLKIFDKKCFTKLEIIANFKNYTERCKAPWRSKDNTLLTSRYSCHYRQTHSCADSDVKEHFDTSLNVTTVKFCSIELCIQWWAIHASDRTNILGW